MVGFVSDSAIEEDLNQASKQLKNSNFPFDPIDTSVVDINGFVFSSSFDESFVDFDSIKDWIKDIPEDPDRVCSDKVEFLGIEEFLEMEDDVSCVKSGFLDPIGIGSDPVCDGSAPVLDGKVEMGDLSVPVKEKMEDSSAAFVDRTAPMANVCESVASESNSVLDGAGCVVKVERRDCEELGSSNLRSSEGLEDRSDPVGSGSNPVVDESSCSVKVEGENCENVGSLSCPIEEVMGKVSLVGAAEDLVVVDGNDMKASEEVNEVDESSSSAESESSTSSSSDSSSSEEDSDDDGDDNGNKKKEEEKKSDIRKGEVNDAGQMEEGEIRDDGDDDDDDEDENLKDMVGWSDDDVIDGDDEDGEGVKKGPIKSKNELKFLPPVPPVDVTLQPCQQTLPVGVVLSIMGTQVIVEGVENHNPLNEGSILWITESRVPLGLVDEIFGPVKNPYYIVRYNSENEVPAQIHEGTPISFVQEFANHVLNDKSVYKKGYDASGENDEEVLDEVEFSDDEKEAEYRRMMKTTKRGTNDQKHGNKKNNKKKVNNRNDNWKMDQPSDSQQRTGLSPLASDKNRHNVSPGAPPLDHGKPGLVPPFPQPAQSTGLMPTPNGFWMNGMPCQPQPSSVFSNGYPAQSMPWPQQNHIQFPYQMPLPNGMPFQQPFDLSQRFLPNVVLPGGQPNFIAGPAYSPWPGVMGQNGFNPTTFGMGLQGQLAHPSQNAGGHGVPFQSTGGVPFQNAGGQGVPFQNTGGQGPPCQNTGGQGVPFQNTGGQGAPFHNAGGQGPPCQNTGGQGVPFQNTGGQGVPFQNTGGQGIPFQNAGGQGPQSQNTGGQGVSAQNTGGQGVPFQNTGGQGVPSAGFCMDQNHNMPPVIPGNTENPRHFSPGASSRGRKPYRRGGGRFSRGRNQH